MYNTYVLGHLDKMEAQRYFNELLQVNNRLFHKIAKPTFQKAYSVCGGSIFLMEAFMQQWLAEDGEGLITTDVTEFSMVRQATRRLMMGLYPESKDLSREIGPPKWTREVFLKVVGMMVESEGFLTYRLLCEKFGKEVIDSMIEFNLMHLRPTCSMSHDVPHH